MRLALIDNYDSFTFNIYQYLAEVMGTAPEVVPNDASSLRLDLDFDAYVISPGPGHPANARDFGNSARIIRDSQRPVLGICLGHQGIVTTHGGRVGRAPEPRHGRTSVVTHDGSELFAGIPTRFDVVRYHSLCAYEPLPSGLEVTARSDDGVVMALAHGKRPLWGVQFHPESIYAEYGKQLLRNFCDLAQRSVRRARRTVVPTALPQPTGPRQPASYWRVLHRVIESSTPVDDAFDQLFGHSESAFWLDSSALRQGLSRFSFMGDTSGPHAYSVTYRHDLGLNVKRCDGRCATEPGDVFTFLQSRLNTHVCGHEALPFDFCGGFVGYLGYELKSVTHGSRERFRARTPDAAFGFIDRFVAYDHQAQVYYAVGLLAEGEAPDALTAWFDQVEADLARAVARSRGLASGGVEIQPVVFRLEADRHQYLHAVEMALDAIRAGESYEVCLTNRLRTQVTVDSLNLYHALRRHNPAPYAAYLAFDGFTVLSSSPERFLRVSPNGVAESKPIKGTRPRGADPTSDRAFAHDLANDVKDRAENLMITDLVRNDFGRVCQIGSVWTPKLMQVETYASVHQLVSTIRGQLRPDRSAIDLVKASFPGGSMTGAPKLRTMEIIDTLEHSARGVYSGGLGYFSLNGAVDLSIVIRTIVQCGNELEIGVGGAVIALSDPAAEFIETLVKGRALMRAIAECVTGDVEGFRIAHQGGDATLESLVNDALQLPPHAVPASLGETIEGAA